MVTLQTRRSIQSHWIPRRGILCLPGIWCPDKMQRGSGTRSMKPTPTDISKAAAPRQREGEHTEEDRDVIGWTGGLRCALKGRLYLTKKVGTLTVLPVSPDKAAVLLLLARNECVGVSSLLTTLLSQGLSCRRRARRHHISEMLDEFFPGGRRGQEHHTYCLYMPGLQETRLSREDSWDRVWETGTLPKGGAIPKCCLTSTSSRC